MRVWIEHLWSIDDDNCLLANLRGGSCVPSCKEQSLAVAMGDGIFLSLPSAYILDCIMYFAARLSRSKHSYVLVKTPIESMKSL